MLSTAHDSWRQTNRLRHIAFQGVLLGVTIVVGIINWGGWWSHDSGRGSRSQGEAIHWEYWSQEVRLPYKHAQAHPSPTFSIVSITPDCIVPKSHSSRRRANIFLFPAGRPSFSFICFHRTWFHPAQPNINYPHTVWSTSAERDSIILVWPNPLYPLYQWSYCNSGIDWQILNMDTEFFCNN